MVSHKPPKESHMLVMPSVNHLLSCSEKAAHLSRFKTQHVNTRHLEKPELISEEFFEKDNG